MQHRRRLILAPIAAFVATAVVAAVIDTGQRTRAEAIQVAATSAVDRQAAAELRRVDELRRSERSCVGAADCAPARAGARVREAVVAIGAWPSEPRFSALRLRLARELTARSYLLDQLAMIEVDGRTSPAERARTDQLREHWIRESHAVLDAELAAGLIDRAEHVRSKVRLRRSEP